MSMQVLSNLSVLYARCSELSQNKTLKTIEKSLLSSDIQHNLLLTFSFQEKLRHEK